MKIIKQFFQLLILKSELGLKLLVKRCNLGIIYSFSFKQYLLKRLGKVQEDLNSFYRYLVKKIGSYPVIKYFKRFSTPFLLATFFIILIKISYFVIFQHQLYYLYNFTLLLILTIVIFKFNLYNKFNKIFSKTLFYGNLFPYKMLNERSDTYKSLIQENYDDLDLKELFIKKTTSNILQKLCLEIFIYLIFLRLIINYRPFFFRIIYFCVIFLLLFNKLLLVIYILSFILTFSRLCYLLNAGNERVIRNRINAYITFQKNDYNENVNEMNYIEPISNIELIPNKNNAIILSCITISTISTFNISYWESIANFDENDDYVCDGSSMNYICVLTIDYMINYEKNINIYDTRFDDFSMSPLRLEFAEKATKTNET